VVVIPGVGIIQLVVAGLGEVLVEEAGEEAILV
jgi:hypothetical protein